MTTPARDAFLQRLQQAVQHGNRAGAAPPLPSRGQVGYQGAGPDLLARFGAELTAAGGVPYPVATREAAVGKIIELVQGKAARKADRKSVV